MKSMKVYTVKKTFLNKEASLAEEILSNTVFSNEDAAIGAMKGDIELHQTPMSEVLVFSPREMQLKTGYELRAYHVEEHEFSDGKLG